LGGEGPDIIAPDRIYLRKCHHTVPILRDFERRLGNLVEGFFATTFRSGLQPVELAKRLLREMDEGKTVSVHEVWAPNHFEFVLSPSDAERFEQAEGALVNELKQVVREAAAERRWGLLGPPEIVFRTDPAYGKGKFGCQASFVEGEPEPALAPAAAPQAEASLVLLEDGKAAKTFKLGARTVTIGRLPECDIVVSDPGASRRHATIALEDREYVLTDLGSTNGTLVNEEPVGVQVLSDGDRITIGTTTLEFRRE
jgi:Protein of unknown function (DUF3662)/Inner membrane component of T3SS, cytoplasmic domain